MYSVSDTYKTEMQAGLRGISTVEVIHSIPNSHNGTVTYPNGLLENIINDYFTTQVQSATFEPAGCFLDGSTYLRTAGANENDEYVSSAMSGTAKTVTGHSYIITMVDTVTAANIPTDIFIKFDSNGIVRPTAMTITMQNAASGTLATANYTTADFDGNTCQLVLPTVASGQEGNLKYIKIEVTAMNLPYAYVRFEKLILGIVNEFGDTDLDACEWKVASSPLSFNIPNADFSFTFLDPEKLYHPSNANGKYDLIIENQQVGFRFGYTLSGGGVEWLNGGLYRTTGEKSITDELIPRVTVKTRHKSINSGELVINLDNTMVSEDEISEVPISLEDVSHSLSTLFSAIGVDLTVVDVNSGANYYDIATVVDANLSLREYAQIMANAYGMMWTVDRGSTVEESVTFTEFGRLVIDPVVHNYDSATLNLYDQTAPFSNNIDGTYLFQFNNSNMMELPQVTTVPSSDGVSFAQFNQMSLISQTERGTYPASLPTNPKLITVDNPFITVGWAESQGGAASTDPEPNKYFGRYIWDYYLQDRAYTILNRGFPELDVGDIVHLHAKYYSTDGETLEYELKKTCIVVSNKISYNGSISGETAIVEWERVLTQDYGVV